MAAAALLARHWPTVPGHRDKLSLCVAGLLLRRGIPFEVAERFINNVADYAGDEEAKARVAKVEKTKRRLDAGQAVTGGPTLAKHIDEEAARKIAEWLDDGDSSLGIIDKMNAKHCVVREASKTRIFNEEHDPIVGCRVYSGSSFAEFRNFYMNQQVQVGTRQDDLACISHHKKCIGAGDLIKFFCDKGLTDSGAATDANRLYLRSGRI